MDNNYKISLKQLIDLLSSKNLLVEKKLSDESERLRFAVKTDSRRVSKEDIFIAYSGVSIDSHAYIPEVISKGVKIVLHENKLACNPHVNYLKIKNGREALSEIWSYMTGNPQFQLKMIGITGTNGKSSVCWMIHDLLKQNEKKGLLIGSIGAYMGNEFIEMKHTTPDPDVLFPLLQSAVAKGCEYVAMEVSSHAIFQKKVSPILFDIVAFTSFSRDHLDLHKDMEEYLGVKLELFDKLSKPTTDKSIHESVKKYLPESFIKNQKLSFYGEKKPSSVDGLEFSYQILGKPLDGFKIQLDQFNQKSNTLKTNLISNFQADNFCLANYICQKILGTPCKVNKDNFKLSPVPGRLEPIITSSDPEKQNFYLYIDYAHTPDALKQVLSSLRQINPAKLTVVVGCGGNRDAGKRPLMAKKALEASDYAVFTTDNPRNEDPEVILKDMTSGLISDPNKYKVITDRKKALQYVVANAIKNEIVLIAGKGHETYQEIKGIRHPFDERIILNNYLNIELKKTSKNES